MSPQVTSVDAVRDRLHLLLSELSTTDTDPGGTLDAIDALIQARIEEAAHVGEMPKRDYWRALLLACFERAAPALARENRTKFEDIPRIVDQVVDGLRVERDKAHALADKEKRRADNLLMRILAAGKELRTEISE